eukprot:m.151835 g.151835  ORF g.151835 m.151835 type:complete len:153 (+) comp30783_c2_seq1:2230-2688(+)
MASTTSQDELEKIRSQEWFHGSITRSLAEQRLADALKGTYLFRESETRPGFSLSLKVPEKVKHFMVAKKDSGLWYLVGKTQEFNSIDELIEWFSKEENPTNSSDSTCLQYPCPTEEESPYTYILDAPVDNVAMDEATTLKNKEKAKQPNTRK